MISSALSLSPGPRSGSGPGKCLGFTATRGYNLHHVQGVKIPLRHSHHGGSVTAALFLPESQDGQPRMRVGEGHAYRSSSLPAKCLHTLLST